MKRSLRFLSAVFALGLVVITAHLTAHVRAQQPSRVALVVHFGDTTLTRCITFDEPELSGYEVLVRSGLPFIASFDTGPGAAICAIEDTGCPAESCLTCKAPRYWSYWQFNNGSWVYSQQGSSNTTVRDGGLEGWSWGEGDPPPAAIYADICTPPPTATPIPPTTTPVPPTATSIPPTTTPTLPPMPEAWFRFDANPIIAGNCTYVRWDTVNTLAAYLDGEAVALNDSREICPSADRNMTLRVVNDYNEQSYTLTLGVVTAAATATPAPASTAPSTATPAPPIAPSATTTSVPTSPPTTPTRVTRPTTTPVPIATKIRIARPVTSPTAVSPSVTATSAPIATLMPLAASPSRAPLPAYLAFGLIAGSLLIGLGWRGMQQR